ncbi:hypothetical protein G9C98_000998 [Cotesia typhae]|uniref:Origin recognition complex subunit 4 n=1 Tax=Cotesia typhae TaxID=2053667 RepID=A0A8J5QMB7_9HYME|nr:hypothetical protein G9C98_000998 [Cotesia typhae]
MSRKKNLDILFNQEINESTMIQRTKKYLKQKIMNTNDKYYINNQYYTKERQHIYDLIRRTVESGESNSALLIGPRGSGKTSLINSVLNELSSSLKDFKSTALIVNLNGLIHTDDRLALRDATRQMQLENVVGNKVFGTFAENLHFLLECLKSGDKKTSKPCIFLIDEFDLFCQHHNQTLLYNLFDIAQSAQSPICVLGITCRLDVIELLEKRVKSRFSHRQIFIFAGSETKEQGGNDNIVKLFHYLLSITDDDDDDSDDGEIDKQFAAAWNKNIDSLVANPAVQKLLQRFYQLDVGERLLKNLLFVIVSGLNDQHCKIVVNDIVDASKIFVQDDKLLMLQGLSVLEFSLIIAMKHETEIYDEPFNFEAILNRYVKFANQLSSIHSVQRPVIMKAFEHIKNLQLLTPVNSSGVGSYLKSEKEYQFFKLLVTSQQIIEAAKNYPGLPTEVSQWVTFNNTL